MKELVLDISKYDEGIDLAAWKRQRGLWGVIIKVGGNEGGRYKDRLFETHYANAKAVGLHIGFYYYTITNDTSNAKADAEHMISLVNGKDYDLPWYMDVEDPRQFALSARNLTDVIKVFCDTLNNKGYYSGLYTGGSAWLNNMHSSELDKYANWIAWWRTNWPTEAGDIGMWQQGGIRLSDGNIVFDDLPGYHDCDWCVIDYPTRIKNKQVKSESDNIQNGSKNANKPEEQTQQSATGGTAEDVLAVAYADLGYYAPNDPERGSKYGRWLAELTGEDWLAGPSTSIWWCCMFASYCLYFGKVKMDGFPTQNTDVALSGGAKKYAVDKYSVKRGDVIIFNWDWNNTTDHIGFATGSFDGTGFTTIEGNIGNAVCEKYRQMGNVAYVLRPPYSGASTTTIEPSVSIDPKNNRDGGKLEIDGIGGWNTIIDWQNQLGAVQDGWIDGQYSGNREYHRSMSNVRYGDTGSKFVMTIQAKVGADTDGYWGKDTSTKIQQWLVDKDYAIEIDGYFGPESVKALQKSLNDGKWK